MPATDRFLINSRSCAATPESIVSMAMAARSQRKPSRAAQTLLVHLWEHKVDTGKRYLFVIDGSKALRAAIREVFGSQQPAQRRRTH